MPPEENFLLETANGETIPVIGIYEAKFQLRQTIIYHKVFVANILDDVLFGLDIMQKYGLKLNFRQRTLVINDKEILMATSGQISIRKLMIKEGTVLPAWSYTIVELVLDKNNTEENTFFIESEDHCVRNGILIFDGVIPPLLQNPL